MSKGLNLSAKDINSLFPVVGATLYGHALVLRRSSSLAPDFISHTHLRGKVEKLSARSRTNFVLKVMRSQVRFLSLLTLSYGQNYPRDGKEVKGDLNLFLTKFKREFGPVKYFWFLEFQGRGAPHFHIGLTLAPIQDEDRRIVADIWSRIAEKYNFLYCPVRMDKPPKKHKWFDGIWSRDAVRAVHEYHEQWTEFREYDGAIRYIVSYATKPYQKTVPADYRNVGRFWGTSRFEKLDDGVELWGNEQQARDLMKEFGRDFDTWDLLPKILFY